jgi:hypothetical protein
MINTSTGTPFVGYASLTNAAPGPTSFTLYTVMGQAAYTLGAQERCYITNITISSSDTAAALIVVDTGGTTPTKLLSAYVSVSQPIQPEIIEPGFCRGIFGVAPRATASAVTSGKTVELVLKGYLGRT